MHVARATTAAAAATSGLDGVRNAFERGAGLNSMACAHCTCPDVKPESGVARAKFGCTFLAMFCALILAAPAHF